MEKRRSTIVSLILLLAIALAMFGDLLFAGGTRVLGHPGSDMFLQYFAWREFGFRELSKGNIALWNPHIFSGAPYFGGMQGALLYPPNWIFLFLPTPVAINWSVALHTFAIGAFMFFWMKQRGLSAAAGFFAGTLVMFGGAFFPHVFAGHLPQLSAMIWSPLIFCSIDGVFGTQRVGWVLLGIFAVAMQTLAGFPQYVFYTGIIAGVYGVLRLIGHWNWRVAAALLSIYPGGALLAAVQLLPAIQTTRETTRGFRLPFQFASMLSLPPENFITLLAPHFLGQMAKYWGRWYLWETSLFIGVVGLVFAIYAMFRCERTMKWRALIVVCVAFLLALGAYTPLFGVLYSWLPGFDRFRSISKFSFLGSLFLCLLAASGVDQLFRFAVANPSRGGRKRIESGFIAAVFAGAAALAIVGWWAASTGSWPELMNASRASGQSYLLPQLYDDTQFIAQSQHLAASSLLFAAGVCAVLGIILTFARRQPRVLFGVIALGAVEMFVFAQGARATFDSATIVSPDEKRFLSDHPDDYRIMNVANPNSAMLISAQDMWGYEATVVRRYAEFMTWSQGSDPDQAMSYVKFVRYDPLFAMLRLRYVLRQHGTQLEIGDAPERPMSHVQLVSGYRVVPGRNAVFDALRSDAFDPRREVILESDPEPKPAPTESSGTARVVAASTDALEIEADIEQPAILLITDAFTPSWRAVALPGSVQTNYKLVPANYILRAVPLQAGHHHLRVEYTRGVLRLGEWISIVAALGFVAALGGRARVDRAIGWGR
jgi:hypothetical protein